MEYSERELDAMIQKILNGALPTEIEIENVCRQGQKIFEKDQTLIYVKTPVTVVGDIHGQFQDLLEVFRICGGVPYSNYLFLGDYGDRGYQSVECFMLLLLMKLRYPARITMLRGNHECR